MTRQQFEELVKKALEDLPKAFTEKLENVAIVVEDYPSDEQLARLRLSPHTTLFGLYQGVAKTKRGSGYTMVPPDKITIFQGPIEDFCHTYDEIKRQVRKTVLHEIAHHFGMQEEEVRNALR